MHRRWFEVFPVIRHECKFRLPRFSVTEASITQDKIHPDSKKDGRRDWHVGGKPRRPIGAPQPC